MRYEDFFHANSRAITIRKPQCVGIIIIQGFSKDKLRENDWNKDKSMDIGQIEGKGLEQGQNFGQIMWQQQSQGQGVDKSKGNSWNKDKNMDKLSDNR